MQEKSIIVNGRRLVYRSAGEGPLVVLLHGFGEDGRIWKHQVDALAGYRFIVPDLPGSGASELAEDMSMEGMAYIIQQLVLQEAGGTGIRDAEKPPVSLIGHSMGGYIALAFAEKYQHLLNGFGLFHSTAFADSEEKKETRRKGISFIEEHGAAAFLKTTIPNLYGPVTKEQHGHRIAAHLEQAGNFSGAALVSYYVSMMQRPDRRHVLSETRLPVLFIMGKHDTAVPMEDGLKQCHLPNQSYVHILENAGHMGMVEEPERSNQILNEYLEVVSKRLPA